MRYDPEQKARTHEKILDEAGRAFREKGLRGIGVQGVMRRVGLTVGGFYAHFKSKDALVAESLSRALSRSRQIFQAALGQKSDSNWLDLAARSYLSRTHRDNAATGCPMAALQSELPRAGGEVREAYEKELLAYLAIFEERLSAQGVPAAFDRSVALIAILVGGLSLSRAVKSRELSDRILKACKTFLVEKAGQA